MVQKLVIVALAAILAGCSIFENRSEVVTVTEYVDVPVVVSKYPDFPDEFLEEFNTSSGVEFKKCGDSICVSKEDMKKMTTDISHAVKLLRAQTAWFRKIREQSNSENQDNKE